MPIERGSKITKEKRHELFGEIAGGKGSTNPENYQRAQIIKETQIDCPKTNIRINLRTHKLHEISRPNVEEDGFDYSEDFDGRQFHHKKEIFLNMKCIVGKGGAQTRSLREVYWFIQGQLLVLKKAGRDNLYFANILDGDEAHAVMSKYQYLLGLKEFADVKDKIYVGDLKGYIDWFAQNI